MSRSRAALFLSFLAAPLVLVVSEGSSQSPTPAPAQAPLPPPSGLIDVPVTKILPGNVDLTPKIKNPVADDAGAAQRGMKYFANFNCIGCHADNGGGGMGPALSNRAFIYGGEPQNIYLTIAQGRPNGMPAWGSVLPESVIWDLVAYVRSISNAPVSTWGNTTSLNALKIEQVPAEFKSTPDPWKFTEPFTDGKKPSGE